MSRSIAGKIRSALCLLVVSCLVAATPGYECYAAVGRAFEGPAVGAEASRFVPGAHASTTWVGRIKAQVLSATLPGVKLLPGAASAPSAPSASDAAFTPPAADLEKKEGASLSEGARQDFMKRVAPYYKETASSSDGVVPVYQSASSKSRGKGSKKPGARRPSRGFDDRPAKDSERDDLGNPVRQVPDGPDSVSDEFGGGRGGVLFGGLQAAKAKKGSKKPPVERPSRGFDDTPAQDSERDGLGNPTRGNIDGPDSVSDGFGGGGGQSSVLFGGGLLGLSAMSAAIGGPGSALFFYAASLFSMLRHEMAHAREAHALGDADAMLDGRLSWKPRDLLSHVDPLLTIVMPLVSSWAFGIPMASLKAVDAKEQSLGVGASDQAIAKARVAWVGPRENLMLAFAGALVYAGLGSLGIAGMAAGTVRVFTTINVMLGLANLLPVFPLDGRFILKGLLYKAGLGKVAEAIESLYQTESKWFDLMVSSGMPARYANWGAKVFGAWMALTPAIALASLASYYHLSPLALLYKATSLLLNHAPVTGVQLAGASLPGMAALGMMLGWGKPEPKAPEADQAVDFIVVLAGARKALAKDMHISLVDVEAFNGARRYAQAQDDMYGHISAATEKKLSREVLSSYNVTPVATYKRINAATLRVDASRAEELKALLESQGHKVYANERRRIIDPVATNPETADPALAKPVTIEENIKITKMETVHAAARKRWGAPGQLGKAALLALSLLGVSIPQPPVAVIDTGIDQSHPQLQGINAPKNATSSDNKDDNGHGTWVTGRARNMAPWLNNITHYKTFVGGGATTDDILKALTMAANDGNIAISNSWGSDDGDPQSPDSQLVLKLAQEGHILVGAAGNNGRAGPNSMGAPWGAAYYKDAKTGAVRIVSIAAADRNKKIVNFSSKGPYTPKTKDDRSTPPRPEASAIGYNTEGAWPAALGPDRVDPVHGSVKAISGTSMSTPEYFGILVHLCMEFGVTKVGEKLDAVANALAEALEKTGQSHDFEGNGFVVGQAARDALAKVMTPVAPGFLARMILRSAESHG